MAIDPLTILLIGGVELVRQGKPLLALSLWATLVIALALIAGGGVLVYLGATGDTEMTLFGATFRTQSTGVAAMLGGAAVAVAGTLRALASLERLAKMPDAPDANAEPAVPSSARAKTKG